MEPTRALPDSSPHLQVAAAMDLEENYEESAPQRWCWLAKGALTKNDSPGPLSADGTDLAGSISHKSWTVFLSDPVRPALADFDPAQPRSTALGCASGKPLLGAFLRFRVPLRHGDSKCRMGP